MVTKRIRVTSLDWSDLNAAQPRPANVFYLQPVIGGGAVLSIGFGVGPVKDIEEIEPQETRVHPVARVYLPLEQMRFLSDLLSRGVTAEEMPDDDDEEEEAQEASQEGE